MEPSANAFMVFPGVSFEEVAQNYITAVENAY
jgi:hypothetical protein